MKERPILFKGEMVRAILGGRKTQTRRVVKVQPPTEKHQLLHVMDSTDRNQVGKSHWAMLNDEETSVIESDKRYFSCPYGTTGDRLWVRETFRLYNRTDECGCSDFPCPCPPSGAPIYRATGDDGESKWTPSIFMPRWASRITLEITDVRVERLQDISETDAKDEGVSSDCPIGHIPSYQEAPFSYCFASLWQSINGPDSWDANPWVWVVEFRRIEP